MSQSPLLNGAKHDRTCSPGTAEKHICKTPEGMPIVTPHTPYLPRTDLQGKDDWRDLFTPGDRKSKSFSTPTPAMRDYLIKYADLCQFTYDNFDNKTNPKAGGFFHYMEDLVRLPYIYPYPEDGVSTAVNVPQGAPARSYTSISDPVYYLSATSGFYKGEFPGSFDCQSYNWIGYVAISEPDPQTGLRDIAIAWRGTVALQEWMSDVANGFKDWDGIGNGKEQVSLGFEAMYRHFGATAGNTLSLQGQVHVALRKMLETYGDQVGSITTTGHSLGGALAALSAFDIANSAINRQGDDKDGVRLPVTAITFEAPRVGNAAFAKAFSNPDGGLKQLRVENLRDVVPLAPALAWSQSYLLPLGWFKGLRFLVSTLRSVKGGPEAMSNDAFRQAGTLYLVDSDTLYGQGLGINERPKGFMWLHQHHNLQLAMYMIDPSRPLPLSADSGIDPADLHRAARDVLDDRLQGAQTTVEVKAPVKAQDKANIMKEE